MLLTAENNKLLHFFHNKYKIIPLHNIVYHSSEYVDDFKNENFSLIPLFIRQHIVSIETQGKMYSFKTKKIKVNLFITVPLKQATNPYFNKIFRMVYQLLTFFDELFIRNQALSSELSIYLYLIELKKVFPPFGKNILETNVNTGFTFSGNLKKNQIFVYRKEEWKKVLIHELIHALGFDFSSNQYISSKMNEFIISFYYSNLTHSFQKNLRIYEAYTETWATILNAIFSLKETQTSHTTNAKRTVRRYTHKRIETLIQKEIDWSKCQYNKIMKHYELSDIPFPENEKKLIFKEKITLYSYYILKCHFLMNLNGFLDFCRKKNFNVLYFNTEVETIQHFSNLIRNSLMMSPVDCNNKTYFEMNSLRMTVNE